MSAPRNQARDGWTVKELAYYLSRYAKNNPDALVVFSSGESGGLWPKGKTDMGIFVDEQIAVVDSRMCGGGVTLGISLHALPPPSLRRVWSKDIAP